MKNFEQKKRHLLDKTVPHAVSALKSPGGSSRRARPPACALSHSLTRPLLDFFSQAPRWGAAGVVFLIYCIRAVTCGGWYIVSYGLGIYVLVSSWLGCFSPPPDFCFLPAATPPPSSPSHPQRFSSLFSLTGWPFIPHCRPRDRLAHPLPVLPPRVSLSRPPPLLPFVFFFFFFFFGCCTCTELAHRLPVASDRPGLRPGRPYPAHLRVRPFRP